MMNTVSNEILCLTAKEGDKESLRQLFNNNLGLIKKICNKASDFYKIDFNETLQNASLVFTDIVKNYDFRNGTKFTTYLGNSIKKAIIESVKKEIRQKRNFPILTYCAYDEESGKLKECFNPVDSDAVESESLINNEYSISAEEVFFRDYKKNIIINALNHLDERHRQYFNFRFGSLSICIEHSREDTARHFGITSAEALKIENETLEQMRKLCVPFLAYVIDEKVKIIPDINIRNRFDDSTEFCGIFCNLISENNAATKCIYRFSLTNLDCNTISGILSVDFEENSYAVSEISEVETKTISYMIFRIFKSLVSSFPESGRLPNLALIIPKQTLHNASSNSG